MAVLLALRGRTQRELAAHLNRDAATISRRMNGRNAVWTADEIHAAAEFFDVPMSAFYADLDMIWMALGATDEPPRITTGYPAQGSLFELLAA